MIRCMIAIVGNPIIRQQVVWFAVAGVALDKGYGLIYKINTTCLQFLHSVYIRHLTKMQEPADGGAPVIDFKNLDGQVQILVEESVKVRELAYCPYSKFKVGAALLGDSGTIYTGCNVENAAYGPSICAERTAVVKAVSSGETKFKSIAVCAQKSDGSIVTPCGVCRQVISEFSKDRNIQVYCTQPDLTKKIMKTSILELLPHRF